MAAEQKGEGGVVSAASPSELGRLYVGSEVGTLRRVVLHRPDAELRRLTPGNKDDLLFDDVLWVKRARQEHDAFADALAERGVEVLLLQDLLTDVLEDAEVRADVVGRSIATVEARPAVQEELFEWLVTMPAAEASTWLVGGICWDDLPFAPAGLAAALARPDDFVLPPLPNQMFTRDTSAWIYGGVSIHAMAKRARQRPRSRRERRGSAPRWVPERCLHVRLGVDDPMLAVLHLQHEVRLAERRVVGRVRVGQRDLVLVVHDVGAVHASVPERPQPVGDRAEVARIVDGRPRLRQQVHLVVGDAGVGTSRPPTVRAGVAVHERLPDRIAVRARDRRPQHALGRLARELEELRHRG